MNIQRLDSQTIALRGLETIFCELLLQIVPSAEPGDHAAARGRLFAAPTAGAHPEVDEDWRTYVEPELHELFASHLSVVEEDLRDLPRVPQAEPALLRVPVAHLEHWIHALNQARLALSMRHELGEVELEERPDLETPRGLALFQIHYYGFLQECFLHEMQR